MTTPATSFEHLLILSDEVGTCEQADYAQPRRSRGYRTADIARVLIATTRQTRPPQAVVDLGHTAQRFLSDAQQADGHVHGGRLFTGAWEGQHDEDAWGLSMWAWGTVVRLGADARIRRQATSCFRRGAAHRAGSARAMAFAGLGAIEVLTARPHYDDARDLACDAISRIGPLSDDPAWPWPEDRLVDVNAVLCEFLVAAGSLLQRPEVLADGVRLLAWLLARQTVDGHLSPTPSGGSGPDDIPAGFPQRPIEVAAMAAACARALAITGEPHWHAGVQMAAQWFAGRNDVNAVMWDPDTDGGYDALNAAGPDLNQGAESTLALLITLQHARSPAA
ncbi:MAG: glycosyltransferase [Euzebya sp.]